MSNYFDVVISNGYNKYGSANWQIKSYPYYEEVAKLLKNEGYSVASIGAKDEYISGTVDMTGLGLLDSGGVIKNSRLLISNDSAMYHYANALMVKNIVIFNSTSIKKNYDKRFHKYSTIIGRDDLKCRPCQAGRRWNKDCKTWDCREIAPEVIYEAVRGLL
jgi:ADP-heptose:LPS heptosyltransferase